jgi:hypothetical protein
MSKNVIMSSICMKKWYKRHDTPSGEAKQYTLNLLSEVRESIV